MMSNGILSANAREAWYQACYYCDYIIDGFVTLQYKKIFVSMLYNAVELLIKQRMLDVNDYRVVRFKSIDENGQPAKDYYNSTDLNNYFAINGTKDSKGKSIVYSIEFHDLQDIHKELFKNYYDAYSGTQSIVSSALTLLGNLRNDETHFYVKDIDFLNGTEFKQLKEFMDTFSNLLDYYGLLPILTADGNHKIKVNRSITGKSDYKAFLKANDDVIKMCNYMNGKTCRGSSDPYEIIDFLFFCTNFDKTALFNDYEHCISLVAGMVQYGVLKITEKKIKQKQPDGTVNEYSNFRYKCNI